MLHLPPYSWTCVPHQARVPIAAAACSDPSSIHDHRRGRLLQTEGDVGIIKPEAVADLLVVGGDPPRDVNLLIHPARRLRLNMAGGWLARDQLER